MCKKILFMLASAVVVMAGPQAVEASFITTKGTVDGSGDPGGVSGPFSGIKQLNSSGRAFTNQIEGAGFAVGNRIRSISAALIGDAVNGTISPIFSDSGKRLIAFSALEGIISATGPVATAKFTTGRLFVAEIPTNPDIGTGDFNDLDADGDGIGFDARNPSSWGFDGLVLAEWILGPDLSVVAGDGSAIGPFPGGLNNQADVSTLSSSQQPGRFIFLEDSANSTGSGAPLSPGDAFIDSGFPIEGLFADIDQTLETSNFSAISSGTPGGVFDAADLAVLNAIAAQAGFADLGGAMTGFATGLGAGPVTHWNPIFSGGPPTGDHRALFSSESHIIGAPEPASSVLFMLGTTVFGVCGVRRRRKETADTV